MATLLEGVSHFTRFSRYQIPRFFGLMRMLKLYVMGVGGGE